MDLFALVLNVQNECICYFYCVTVIQYLFMCNHYNIQCSIESKCCNKNYSCKRCHDMNESHKINKNSTNITIICTLCEHRQKMQNECENCMIKFAEYYCEKCCLFSHIKDCFHCDECNECKLGKQIDFFHCNNCNCCLHISLLNSHECVSNRLDNNCSICMEKLENNSELFLLKCGHLLHKNCFDQYKENYLNNSNNSNNSNILFDGLKCPLCSKITIIYDKI
jgi:RING finger/CHY zinc finger protein 1